MDIAKEEKTHAVEFLTLLKENLQQAKELDEGKKEVKKLTEQK